LHRRILATRASCAGLLLVTSLAVACSDDTPTTPSTPVVTTTDVFIGTLPTGETRVHTFVVAASGTANITLGSLTIGLQTVTQPMTLVLGTPSEGNCTTSTSISTRPALTSSLSYAVSSGTYCVSIADTNSALTAEATYSVRVVHP